MEQRKVTTESRRSKHLNKEERRFIEVMWNKKTSVKDIAEALERSPRTIYRELDRGEVFHLDSELRSYATYSSDRGQADYEEKCSHRGYKPRVDQHPEMKKYIRDALTKKKWAPDIIAWRMEMDIGVPISTKTIYNSIDAGRIPGINNGMLLEKAYRRKRSRRQVLRNDKRCPGRKSIEDRPAEVESRDVFGYWEIDLVVGKRKGSSGALLTLVERKTRYCIITKLKNQKQESVIKALNQLERRLGAANFRKQFKSITADNGSEFLDYKSLEQSVCNILKRTTFYYAHSYASWERGSNENLNRMIRRFIPKGTDIGKITRKQIKEVEEFLCNYPRRILNYKTPEECYKQEVA